MSFPVRYIGGPIDGEVRNFTDRPPNNWKEPVLTCNPLLVPLLGGAVVPDTAVYALFEVVNEGFIYQHVTTLKNR